MRTIPSDRTDNWPSGTFLGMLSRANQSALLSLGERKEFRQGEAIMRESESSDYVVVLVQAVVKVTKSLENGRVALLSIKVGGDVIGEMAALSGEPRSATVTVCTDTRARKVSAAEFRSYLEDHPEAHLALTQMIMQTLRWADKRRIDFNGYPTLVRLARVLDELTERYGQQITDGVHLDLGLTQRELGALVGAEEDAARKELRALRDRGVIKTGYRAITIVNRPALRKIAYENAKSGYGTI
jgi:CRP/FNR family cyclic AMP-dependent transcriptional regulator